MKKLLTGVLFLLSFNLMAATSAQVKVKGMVCAFCSSGVEKTFKKQAEVQDVNVDMDKKLVSISFKDGKDLSDKKITDLIEASGFNVADISREK